MDHYFSKKPETESNPLFWSCKLRNFTFQFKTDHSVFSKKYIDFGSRLLIETFTEPEVPGPVLDAGCGYGPIGLAIARAFPNRKIHMFDINERAVRLAKENALHNEIHNVEVFESDGFSNVTEKEYAAVVTNPPVRAGKKVVHAIFENSFHHLKRGGELWLVIQKKQGAPSAKKKIGELYGNVEIVKKEKGYYILRAKKGLTLE